MEVGSAEDAYLRAHVWGLLATGRSGGAPQMSMVAYDWDGADIVISCRKQMAKFANAKRNDQVVFAVPDDVDNLTITGVATCHESGPKVEELTARLRDTLARDHDWASSMLDRDIASGLSDVGRVIIQIIPSSLHLIQPLK